MNETSGFFGVPKDDHISTLDLTEMVDELIDQDPLPIRELGSHAHSLHAEGLDDIGNEQHTNDDGNRKIVE